MTDCRPSLFWRVQSGMIAVLNVLAFAALIAIVPVTVIFSPHVSMREKWIIAGGGVLIAFVILPPVASAFWCMHRMFCGGQGMFSSSGVAMPHGNNPKHSEEE